MCPTSESVYEWHYDIENRTWVDWMTTIPDYKCNPDMPFSEIIVPTSDTVRYTFLMQSLLLSGRHVLAVGETGTGKTLAIMDMLSNAMPAEYENVFMTFSARTSANQTQVRCLFGNSCGISACLLLLA